MPDRGAVRIMPRRPVPVDIISADIATQGMIANISESGVCLWTDTALSAGDVLVLGFAFPGQSQPFHAAGCVVWAVASGSAGRTSQLGLRWPHTTGPHHELLKTLIANC